MGQTPINQANGHVEHGQRAETHSVDVSTGSGGGGSATVSWDDGFSGNVRVFPALPEQGDVWISSKGGSQATVNVANVTANSTVTVEVVAFGDD